MILWVQTSGIGFESLLEESNEVGWYLRRGGR